MHSFKAGSPPPPPTYALVVVGEETDPMAVGVIVWVAVAMPQPSPTNPLIRLPTLLKGRKSFTKS